MLLADKFTELVIEHQDFSKYDKVLVAVSGGVDSIVLLDLLLQLPEAYRPEISVAHVDHQLRPTAAKEKAFVEAMSFERGLPFYSYTWPKEVHPQSGIEKTARIERYCFFSKVMTDQALNKLVTGHHRGDQAETVLMRLVRGSALEYLSGIKRIRDFQGKSLIRPLLDIPKSSLYAYAEEKQLKYVEDETNQVLDYTRNRYRNQILPLLEKENEAVESHLTDFSREVVDIWAIARPIIEKRVQECAIFKQGAVEIDSLMLLNEATGMQRQILKVILNRLYKVSETVYKQKHIDLVIDWLKQTGPNSTLDLPNPYQAVKTYQKLTIQNSEERQASRIIQPLYLNVGDWRTLPPHRKIGLFHADELPQDSSYTKKLIIKKDSITLPLKLRNRQNGDRISPLGMNGTKKVKDLLIDKKIPINKRDELILVEEATGNLLWIIDVQESRLSIHAKPDKMHYVLLLEEI